MVPSKVVVFKDSIHTKNYASRLIINSIIIAYIFIVSIFFLTSTDFYLSSSGRLPIQPIILAVGLPTIIFLYIINKEMLRDEGRELVGLYKFTKDAAIFYYLITIVHLLFYFYPNGAVVSLYSALLPLFNLWFIIAFISIGLIREARSYIRLIAVLSFYFYFSTVLLDLLQMGMFSRVEGRAAGLAVNPNTGAFTLVMLMILGLNWKKLGLSDMVLCGIAAIGVFVTFSRGGLIIYLLSLVGYLIFISIHNQHENKLKSFAKLPVFLLLLYGMISAGFAWTGDNPFLSQMNGEDRLMQFAGLFHEDDNEVLQDSRVKLAQYYLDLAIKSPILGYGTGFSQSQPLGPHNLYLLLWTDYGIAGLTVLIYGLYRLIRFFWFHKSYQGVVFVLIFIVEGFFDHNLLTFRPFMIALTFLFIQSYWSTKHNLER